MCFAKENDTFTAYAGLTGRVRNRIQGCIRVLFWWFLLQKYPSTFPTVKKGQVIGLADTCTLYPMHLYFESSSRFCSATTRPRSMSRNGKGRRRRGGEAINFWGGPGPPSWRSKTFLGGPRADRLFGLISSSCFIWARDPRQEGVTTRPADRPSLPLILLKDGGKR